MSRGVVEKGGVGPGVELQASGRGPVGQACRDDEQAGQWLAVWCLIGRYQWDMRSLDFSPHRARVVEAEQFVPVVDQHVEVLKEILAENAANVAIY